MSRSTRKLLSSFALSIAAAILALACMTGCQATSATGTAASGNNAEAAASSNPNGYGAVEEGQSVGSLEFRNSARLKEHYQKHGIDMGYSSPEEYLAGANAVISNPNALHKQESDDGRLLLP